MRFSRLIACCWPGLLSLWFQGGTGGLLHAIAFATVLNFGIWAQGARPDLVSLWLRIPLLVGIFCWWLLATKSQWQSLFTGPGASLESKTVVLFRQAQAEYLKGRWFEARGLLQQVLELDSEDPEATLLLATLLRREGELAKAAMRLEKLSQSERAWGWRMEILAEQEILGRRLEERDAQSSEPRTDETIPTDSHSPLRRAESERIEPRDSHPQDSHESAQLDSAESNNGNLFSAGHVEPAAHDAATNSSRAA